MINQLFSYEIESIVVKGGYITLGVELRELAVDNEGVGVRGAGGETAS